MDSNHDDSKEKILDNDKDESRSKEQNEPKPKTEEEAPKPPSDLKKEKSASKEKVPNKGNPNKEKEKEKENEDEEDTEGKEPPSPDTLIFYLNLNLIKIINDEALTEDVLFPKIISQIKISTNNIDFLGIYIYIHFLFRNSYSLLISESKKGTEFKGRTLSDYLDDKISSFNFDKLLRYIQENKLYPKSVSISSEKGLLFEFVKKEIDDNDINHDICCQKMEDNNLKIILNYNLICKSMYSKGQQDLFFKLYIMYIINQNNFLLPIVKSFLDLIKNPKFEPFNEEMYLSYVDKILKENNDDEIIEIIDNELKEQIKYFIELNDQNSLLYLEKFLIQLLGHHDINIRAKATVLLNIFYDGHILQLDTPFNPVIKYLKEDFEVIIGLDKNINPNSYFLFVSTPVRIFYVKNETNNVDEDNNLIFNLGEFKYCGYYDYSLVKVDNLKPELDTKGRYIVQNNDIKYLNCHSLIVDLHNCTIDQNTNKLKKQGTYKDVINSLSYFNKNGVNALNLIGVLERDIYLNKTETASPFSVINRSKICSLLGTENEFKQIVDDSQKMNIKVFIDMLSSVSSSHYHKKYNKLHLSFIDKYGKLQTLFGTEGDSVNYEDNMTLNYRDISAWNLLLNDIIELCQKYNISGIHLNNAQTWPILYSVDLNEMLREQVEDNIATRHYTNYEIINGDVVIPNQECGYWNAFQIDNNIENVYPNPLFIKLTKNIWERYPEFIFIGEFNNNNQKYNNREFVLGKSGLVIKMNILPEVFTRIYNINTGLDSIVAHMKKNSINDILKSYYDYIYKNLPLNSFFISSSGGIIWPYPNLLYGPGCLPYISALFTLNNIPMTFMNEIYGKSKRYQLCSYFDSIKTDSGGDPKKKSVNANDFLTKYKVSDIEKQIFKNKSNKNSNSSQLIKAYYEKMRSLRQSHDSLLNGNLHFLKNENDKVLSFCREDLDNNEIAFIAINFSDGVTKIDLDFSYLLDKEEFQNLNINTIIKIENWNDSEQNYYFMDEIFSHKHRIHIMPYDTFMIGFSIVKPFDVELYRKTFSDSLIELCKKINDNLRNDNANKEKLKQKKNVPSLGKYNYDSNIISSQLKYLLTNSLSLCEFAKWLYKIQTTLAEYNIKYLDYFNNLSFITENPDLSTQYYKYISMLNALPSYSFEKYPKISLYSEQIQRSNRFGPLCFITPEIGRWSSIGGLGVMIDELTQCLSLLGQDVFVISPYYHLNKDGKSDYLENDPNGFIYLNDLEVKIDKIYTFKIYFGKVNGVKLYFLYNKEVFPSPYYKSSIESQIAQLALMGKASLELICNIQCFPSVVISNDWSTGLVPAYGKSDMYKGIFKYTSFLHIFHNLEEGYQGLIYLSAQTKEDYSYIYQLNPELLLDKNNKRTINPCQAALLSCDQWGTVSKSYKDELLEKSSMKELLKEFPRPFGYSNGIYRENRIYAIKQMIHDVIVEENTTSDFSLKDIDIFNDELKNKCKAKLQKKYFGQNFDNKKILFSFLGRITEQKGVKLILETAEELIKKHNILILIAGKANSDDKYAQTCIEMIENLKKKYPKNFWASPKDFFNEPVLLNYGSDFCIMPSLFEPGGIVQHEFFIAGTPVIGYKTGGLKDSITEYNPNKKTGNGFIFENYDSNQLMAAILRAIKVYNNKNDYQKCCFNAFNSAIDVMDVAHAWGDEFYRIKEKVFFDRSIVDDETFSFKKNLKEEKNNFDKEMELFNDKTYIFSIKEPVEETKDEDDDENEEGYLSVSFIYNVEKGKKYKNVQISGTWDKWAKKFELYYEPLNNCWKTIIILPKGTVYHYKYILDNEWAINPNEKKAYKDNDVINNEIET